MKSYLFIAGVPRSGTTALAQLLAAHPSAVIGIERYKRLVDLHRIHELVPERFERDRFLTFRDDETNLSPERASSFREHYAEVAERFDEATVFGDKVPRYYYVYHHLLGVFPNSKVLCILRNPYEVASLWNRRARNPDDPWAPEEDARRSIVRWNEALRIYRQALAEYPQDVLLVEHARLFGGDATYFEWLSREVGLPAGEAELAHHAAACERWAEERDDPLALDEEELQVIRKRSADDLYERLTGEPLVHPDAVSSR